MEIFWDKKFGNAMMKVFIWSSLGWVAKSFGYASFLARS